jgi:hypothetical protein
MKRFLPAALTGFLIVLLLSCATPPPPVSPPAENGGGGVLDPAAAAAQLAQRMRQFLENGLHKLDQGAISEGIAQLVAVLAEGASATDSAAGELKRRAETELAKIRAGLALEAGTEWLDANKNQRIASSVNVGGQSSLNPSVILTLNYGGAGKALVTGAPIQFAFVQGGGVLAALVNTSDYGQANCNLASLDSTDTQSIIRASLVYRVKGFAYAFEGMSRDFVYAPPARKATILALERAGAAVVEDPAVLHAVYSQLKAVAFDFSFYNGKLLGEEFLAVFGGNPQAIRRLGLQTDVSYLVVLMNDAYNVSQVELQGKKYNIWKAQASCSARVIRVADGKVLYSGLVQAVAGQGGTSEKASLDGLRNAASAMQEKVGRDLPEIERALAGKE